MNERPGATAVMTPVADTVATLGVTLFHTAVLPTIRALAASNGRASRLVVVPTSTLWPPGPTTTEATALDEPVTVTVAVPAIPSDVAVIVTGPPGFTAVTTPEVDTLATDALLVAHAIVRKSRLSVMPAESFNTGTSVAVWPLSRVEAGGVIEIVFTGISSTKTSPFPIPVRTCGPAELQFRSSSEKHCGKVFEAWA